MKQKIIYSREILNSIRNSVTLIFNLEIEYTLGIIKISIITYLSRSNNIVAWILILIMSQWQKGDI